MTAREWCPDCDALVRVADDHIEDEMDGPRVVARWRVIDLSCGHDIQTRIEEDR